MSFGKSGPVVKVLDPRDTGIRALPSCAHRHLGDLGYVISHTPLVTKVGRSMLNCEAWAEEQTVYKGEITHTHEEWRSPSHVRR